jgi:signal transduction histidine kinase
MEILAGILIGFIAGCVVSALVLRRWILPRMQKDERDSHSTRIAELTRAVGGLAHEIKNPLSTLNLNLQLLAEDWQQTEDEREQRNARRLLTLQKEAQRLSDILNDFLRFAGRIELQREVQDVNDVVSELIEFFRPQASSSDIELREAISPDPLYANVDSDMLKQAMLNLLVNSQQAMANHEESRTKELIVRTAMEQNEIVISIIDTGPGIPEDRLPRIFEAYYSTKKGGSGLGLSIARKIVEAHNGEIQVHSQMGNGTCFIIKLPEAEHPLEKSE